jgi:formylmethanofuran dehydrogenase subunit A
MMATNEGQLPPIPPKKTLGQLIDSLGLEISLKDGDLVGGAIILIKVIEEDGTVRMSGGWDDGLSWIERLGMLQAARVMENNDMRSQRREF